MPARTKPNIENQVVRLIAQRTTYTDIAQQTGLSTSGIKKIKRRNTYKLQVIEGQLTEWQVNEAKKALEGTYRLIMDQLDRAGAGLIDIPMSSLLAVSREMNRQSLLNK